MKRFSILSPTPVALDATPLSPTGHLAALLAQNPGSLTHAALASLLAEGADPNLSFTDSGADGLWQKPLHALKDPVCVTLLLCAGATPNATNSAGQTPAFAASAQDDVARMTLLRNAGADFLVRDARGVGLLFVAGQEVLLRLIAEGLPLDTRDDNGETALHAQVRQGRADAVRALVQAGADVHAQSHDGHTPLGLACRLPQTPLDILADLLAAGASPNMCSAGDSLSPAHALVVTRRAPALHRGAAQAIALLAAHGADFNLQDNRGLTALHGAAFFDNQEAVRALLRYGADLHLPNAEGLSAFDFLDEADPDFLSLLTSQHCARPTAISFESLAATVRTKGDDVQLELENGRFFNGHVTPTMRARAFALGAEQKVMLLVDASLNLPLLRSLRPLGDFPLQQVAS